MHHYIIIRAEEQEHCILTQFASKSYKVYQVYKVHQVCGLQYLINLELDNLMNSFGGHKLLVNIMSHPPSGGNETLNSDVEKSSRRAD